jgi:hypothetical protein
MKTGARSGCIGLSYRHTRKMEQMMARLLAETKTGQKLLEKKY